MNELSTPQPTIAAAEAVTLSRGQVWLLAFLICVPVPVLSYAAGVVPLPEMLERAAASFAPLFSAAESGEVRLVRADGSGSVEALAIRYLPSPEKGEQADAVTAAPATHRASVTRRRLVVDGPGGRTPLHDTGGDTTTAPGADPPLETPSPPPVADETPPLDQPKAGPDSPGAPEPGPSNPSGKPTGGSGSGGNTGTGGNGQGPQGGGSGSGKGKGTPPSSPGNGGNASPPESPPGQGSGGNPPTGGSAGGGGGGGNGATGGGGGSGAPGGGGGRP